MDKLRAMSVFVAVARLGSLSSASRELGQPLTNVSRLLSQLETDLGTALFSRSARGMDLTAEGREYLIACRLILDDIDQAESHLKEQTTELAGALTVTAPEAFGKLHVLPVLSDFLAKHRGIQGKLLLQDRRVDMVAEGVDVAIRIGALRDSAHLATAVGTQRMITCASPGYLAGRAMPLRVADLHDHDCICFAAPPSGLRWVFRTALGGRKTIRIRPRLTVNSAEAAVSAAIRGLGVTRVLAYQASTAIDTGQLVPLLADADDTDIPVHILRWPHRASPHRVRAFIDYTAERLRAI